MADHLTVAVDAARRAGALQREGFRRPLMVRETSRHDIKLQTDVDCEELIRGILRREFPDYGLLAEEGGGEVSAGTPTWIVDPLDGTVNYARRIPHFCVSIGLQMAGDFVLGVVYDPMLDELFTAVEGGGAFLNDERIRVSEIAELAAANVAVGFAKSARTIDGGVDNIRDLAHQVRKIRIMGAAALDLAYVAAGRFDGFMEYGLRTWDIAAGAALIKEAGGRIKLSPDGPHRWDVRADNGLIW